ncbi:hypothetical protein ACFLUH_01035 [Chloroflexota bacterium]
MTENSYDQVDDLFAKVRLCLVEIRKSNPDVADDLRNLITQLEDCVEMLIVDSLRLRSLEGQSDKINNQDTSAKKD